MKDYSIHIEPDTFHAYPAFAFTPEGRKGEQQVIDYIKEFLKLFLEVIISGVLAWVFIKLR